MEKYTLTAIKAVAHGDTEVQDAVLIHDNTYDFNDQDVIIFGHSMDDFTNDEEVEMVLKDDYCPTWFSHEDGVYYAN